MLFGLLPLVLPATAYTPVIVVETSEVTVTPTDVVVKTATSTPTDEPALPTATSEGILTVSLLYPSWLKSILATAIPSTWEERLKTDAAFEEAEYERESEGIMPAWYSRLPSDAKYALSSEKAVEPSEIVALDLSLLAQATEVTTTASPSVTSSSTTVITGVTVSGSQTLSRKSRGRRRPLVARLVLLEGLLRVLQVLLVSLGSLLRCKGLGRMVNSNGVSNLIESVYGLFRLTWE